MRTAFWMCLALGCRPYQPPALTPPLQVAQAPLRVLRDESGQGGLWLVVRAGSAYDPPSREGLAFATAHVLAVRLGASVQVGPETVVFSLPPNLRPDAAAAMAAPVQADEVQYAYQLAAARLRSVSCKDVAQQVGMAWTLAGHPYGHAVAGRLSTITTFLPTELSAFYGARYVRDAAMIAVEGGGGVPALDLAFAPRLSRSPTPAVLPSVDRPQLVVEAHVDTSCTFVTLRPDHRTWQNVAQLGWLAQREGWPSSPSLVDPLAWAVAPWPLQAAAASPATSTGAENGQSVAAAFRVASASAAVQSQAALLAATPRLRSEPALELQPDPGWWSPDPSDPRFLRVVVTPDATPWRASESSATVVVLDREAVLR